MVPRRHTVLIAAILLVALGGVSMAGEMQETTPGAPQNAEISLPAANWVGAMNSAG